ncbi:MAG: NAD-dependent deacylase [Vicinamibacterales bacterium]|nr:NAD-dependent deacylase [Vicinamibacterales bacterium]
MSTNSPLEQALQEAAAIVSAATAVMVLTGAGISAESGVPVFRGPGGLWNNHRPEDLATPQAFARNPGLVWEWYRWRRGLIAGVRPNPGHESLVRLERRPGWFVLATQNVDGLHRQAGSASPLELHGSIWQTVCARRCGVCIDESPWHAGRDVAAPPLSPDGVPRCRCGSGMRPGVVWFGESLEAHVVGAAIDAAERAEVLLVIGTSSLVHPAAALPALTLRAGGAVIEINPDVTPLSAAATHVLRGPAGLICPRLESLL